MRPWPSNIPFLALLLVLVGLLAPWAVSPVGAQSDQALYERARKDYQWLATTPRGKVVYQNWQSLYDRFASIYTADPYGELAPQCLWWMGRVRAGAWEQFQRQSDFLEAVDLYRRFINHFPRSRLADDAQFNLGRLYEQAGDKQQAYLEYLRLTVNQPKGDMLPQAKARLDALEKDLRPAGGSRSAAEPAQRTGPEPVAAAPSPDPVASTPAPQPERSTEPADPTLASLGEVRHWSTPSYTRVVLSLDRPVPYSTNLLPADKDAEKPRRLYVDLRGTRLKGQVKETLPIDDGLLSAARAGQFSGDTVRVVLDMKNLISYKIFTLDNPFRVVVDCFGKDQPVKVKTAQRDKAEPKTPATRYTSRAHKVPRGRAEAEPQGLGLAAQLGLGVRRVVIDPGHGGKDPGTVWRGIKEKDLTLDVAKRVAEKLRRQGGLEVLLTRSQDVTLPLEDRTAFANTKEADLFISIHVNAAPSTKLNGLETYFLNLAADEESMRVAARENATSQRSISDLQVILKDLMLSSKINESNRLAHVLHRELLSGVRRHHEVDDLKVKQAPFYVLIGARMPAVLTEIGFLTNPHEHQRLINPAYRELLADGIARGVNAYAQQLRSGADLGGPPQVTAQAPPRVADGGRR
ncbi:MAG: N-acetylmuramoyl-L-alanine amidase [Desulfarculus sp.]|nr:N-acetylmuramoyl-L-alanine amidase [Desulfarculus sp.]